MLKKAKQTFVWTIFYAAAAGLIFYALFHFNIYSARHWAILSRMRLRGADGFLMGAMIVAVIPAYLATAVFVWKNGKWPIQRPAFLKKKKEEKEEEKIDKIAAVPELPANLPDEMIFPYIRAKNGIRMRNNAADFIKPPVIESGAPAGSASLDSFMPPPVSFDAPVDAGPQAPPMFRDFSFNEEPKVKIENGAATYIFDEPGFWIADDENWFAEGRQIKSPVAELLAANASERTLVLKNKNIQSLDDIIPNWIATGIKVES